VGSGTGPRYRADSWYKRRTYLAENISALNISLSADELQRIAQAMPVGAAAGMRYPARTMHTVNL